MLTDTGTQGFPEDSVAEQRDVYDQEWSVKIVSKLTLSLSALIFRHICPYLISFSPKAT